MPQGLTFNVFGRDVSAGSTLRRVSGEADQASGKISSSFKKMGGLVAGALAGAGVADFFKDSFAEATEAQKVGAQTTAVLKSTGGAAHVTAGQIGNLSTAISNKVGIDDEAIQSGENLLLTFTNVRNEAGKGNDIFNQSTQIMTDMSVALGQDMSSSAVQLGKALNDPIKGITALQRVGVTFTQQQRDQIKAMVDNNDTLGAQKLILGELTREFGGSAAAQATSADKMKVAFGNVEEQVGTALMPVITDLSNFLTNDVLPAFSATVGWLQKNGYWLKYVAGAAAAMWVAWKGYTIATAAITAVQGGLATLTGWFTSTAAAATAAGTETTTSTTTTASVVTGSAAEQQAALTRLGIQWGLTADAAATSAAGVVAASEEAGAASSTAFGPVGIAIGAVVGVGALAAHALGLFGGASKDAVKPTQELTSAIQNDNDALGKNTRSWVANSLEKKGAYDAALKLGISQKTLTDAMMGNTEALAEVQAAQTKATYAGMTGIGVTAKQAEKARELKGANDTLKNAIGDVSAALDVNKRAADNIDKGLGDYKQHADSAAGSSNNLAGAAGKAAGSFSVMAGKTVYTAAQLSKLAQNGQLTLGQLTQLQKDHRVNLDSTYAQYQLSVLESQIRNSNPTLRVHITPDAGAIHIGGRAFGISAYAQGTGFATGGMTLVGERGPELVSLPRGSKVASHATAESMARMSGGGDTILNITIPVQGSVLSERDLVGAVERGVRQAGVINIGSRIR